VGPPEGGPLRTRGHLMPGADQQAMAGSPTSPRSNRGGPAFPRPARIHQPDDSTIPAEAGL